MRPARGYPQTDWIDPRVEVRLSLLHGKGMFARAPIAQGEVVTIWGGTLLLDEVDLVGQRETWIAAGYVWATVGEGLYLAQRLEPGEEEDHPWRWCCLDLEPSPPALPRCGSDRRSVPCAATSLGAFREAFPQR